METSKKFIVVLSGVLLAFFLIALACFVFNYSESLIHYLFVAQLVVFSLAAGSVIIYLSMPTPRKTRALVKEITKIVLLTEANEPADEFSLIDRTSALIGKNGELFISFENGRYAEEYAVINCVESCWYIERVSEALSVGLKRAGEQYVYKLKPGMCYMLHINDTVYIENERLLVI